MNLQERNAELELQNRLYADLSFPFPRPEHPLVSIIVPCYNNYSYTRNCLASVAMRSGELAYEVILADDHSTDETAAADRSFPNLRIIPNESGRKGFTGNVTYAAQFARGQYLLLLNNDTIVHPDWLLPMVQVLEARPDIGVAGSVIGNPYTGKNNMGFILHHTGHSLVMGRDIELDSAKAPPLVEADMVQGSCFLIRKKLWDECGGFDPVYAPGFFEETDLCMKLKIEKGLRTVCCTKSRIDHFESKTFKNDNQWAVYERNRVVFSRRYGAWLEERENAAVRKFHRPPMESVFLDQFAAQWGIHAAPVNPNNITISV